MAKKPHKHNAPGAGDALARALALHQGGKLPQAAALYRKVLAAQPNHPDALHFFGILHHQQGDHAQAEALIRESLAAQPNQPGAHNNLGNVLLALDRPRDAAEAFRAARKLAPDMVEAAYNLGNALLESGDPEAAEAAFRECLTLAPNHAGAWNNLGNALRDRGDAAAALNAYARAAALAPAQAEAHHNVGVALHQLGRHADATAAFRKALSLNPRNPHAHLHLGVAQLVTGQDESAIESLGHAVELEPDLPDAWAHLLLLLRKRCDWERAARAEERVLTYAREGRRAMVPFPLLLLDLSPAELGAAMRCYGRKLERPGAEPTAPAEYVAAADGRITIGYLSPDFGDHPVAHIAAELFARHDRERFRVIGYSLRPREDNPWRTRLEEAFDDLRDIHHLDPDQAARAVRDDGVDILVDLAGHTRNARPELLARRPAPVQAGFLGWACTSGARYMDYVLTDPVVAPAEHQPHFTEQLAHLPHHYLTYDDTRPAPPPPPRASCGLPEDGFVLCGFTNPYKLGRELFHTWLDLLKDTPDAVLWLSRASDAVAGALTAEAQNQGVDPARLVFAGWTADRLDHVARIANADLFLDTHPYNAHSTVLDALWAGCPVVARMGRTFAARVAASALTTLGLPELIAADADGYATLARELARDRERLAALRARMAELRQSSPLFDGVAFARHLEQAYAIMWQRYRDGRPPAPIKVIP